MVEVTLTIHSPEGTQQMPLAEGRLTIGRKEAAALMINDEGLSRLHASLHREGDRVWVLDEGSTNGSFVNHRPVPPNGTPLADGDEIFIGNHTSIRISI